MTPEVPEDLACPDDALLLSSVNAAGVGKAQLHPEGVRVPVTVRAFVPSVMVVVNREGLGSECKSVVTVTLANIWVRKTRCLRKVELILLQTIA